MIQKGHCFRELPLRFRTPHPKLTGREITRLISLYSSFLCGTHCSPLSAFVFSSAIAENAFCILPGNILPLTTGQPLHFVQRESKVDAYPSPLLITVFPAVYSLSHPFLEGQQSNTGPVWPLYSHGYGNERSKHVDSDLRPFI